jgi:hypothetical protein
MLFSEVAMGQSSNLRTLSPLCPTRWTVRVDAVQNVVISQYECVLDSLEAYERGTLQRWVSRIKKRVLTA